MEKVSMRENERHFNLKSGQMFETLIFKILLQTFIKFNFDFKTKIIYIVFINYFKLELFPNMNQ